ncbi:hypothetical protein SISNIDRAFT_491710 [Sistotremastrum niveocremeum HHB9708]|uniref:F-box domain-containing protein n=1 Tax=Sistotremastrum niveocremeum HHB9708 TaxID=1314777 RepID=A0A164MHB8_9AGAM|nr:hypothetical protein SISNIDRAFT_491710 [Sistotremastrum niveocremeum HHB9708]
MNSIAPLSLPQSSVKISRPTLLSEFLSHSSYGKQKFGTTPETGLPNSIIPEILLKILDGVELNVLVAIAQTSSRLYNLTKTHRSVWMGAEDHLELPLQEPETLSTIPVESILRLAMRAVDLQRRFLDPEVKPLRISKVDRKPWYIFNEKWIVETKEGAAQGASSLWILPAESADSYKDFEPVICFDGRFAFRTVKELDDRNLVVIYTVVPYQHSVSDVFYLKVLLIEIPPSNDGNNMAFVTESKSYLLPAQVKSLDLVGSNLFIRCWGDPPFHYLMLDYERNIGAQLVIRTPDGEPAMFDSRMGYRKAFQFHPGLDKIVLVLEVSLSRSVLLLADMPTLDARPSNEISDFYWKPGYWDATHIIDWPHVHLLYRKGILHKFADTLIAVDSAISPRYIPVHEFVFFAPHHVHRQFVSFCFDTEANKLVALAFPPEDPADAPTKYWTRRGPLDQFVDPQFGKECWMIICPDSSGRKLLKLRITFPPGHSEDKSYLVARVDMRKGELMMDEEEDDRMGEYQRWIMQY